MEVPRPRSCAAHSAVVLLSLGELGGCFLNGQLQVRQLRVHLQHQEAVGFQDILLFLKLLLLLEDLLSVRFFAAVKVLRCAPDLLGDGLGLPLEVAKAFQLFDVRVSKPCIPMRS